MMFIFGSSYFVGMFWYIMCDLNIHYNTSRAKDNPRYIYEKDNFIQFYHLDEYEHNWQRAITNSYFAFTSLSTVGFGDYHPTNSYERLICAGIIYIGNMIFGLIIGMFNGMIDEIKYFGAEIECAE